MSEAHVSSKKHMIQETKVQNTEQKNLEASRRVFMENGLEKSNMQENIHSYRKLPPLAGIFPPNIPK